MVVMIVTEKDAIDSRQVFKQDAGIAMPLRAQETHWAHPARPYGIGEKTHACSLEQNGSVIDECDMKRVAIHLSWWRRSGPRRNPSPPWSDFSVSHPLHCLPETVIRNPRVKEPPVSEMFDIAPDDV